MRLIILAAGQGFKLDGFNKLLLKDPKTGETILDRYLKLFKDYEITVVAGYKSVSLMNKYPHLNYILNQNWSTTASSYSLGLALDTQPCVIVFSDLFFDENMAKLVKNSPENCIFVSHAENKHINTVRCKLEKNIVKSIYRGDVYDNPETMGIYKISCPEILREWKKRCLANKNLFVALNLPINIKKIFAIDKGSLFFHEVNTPLDYLNLIKKTK